MDIEKEKKTGALLYVNNLTIRFKSQRNIVYAVNNLSFKVYSNEILGIIGESGCGKTVTCRSVLRLNKSYEEKGSIKFQGQEIFDLDRKTLNQIRGNMWLVRCRGRCQFKQLKGDTKEGG